MISIISISFNNLDGLKKTINSYSEQNYTDKELIIIDGGSTDGTKDFLESLQITNFKFISERDKGISDAFNKGIILSEGTIINFMNSGDTFLNKDSLSNVASIIKRVDNHETYIFTFQAKTNPTDKVFPNQVNVNTPEKRSMISHQASFIKKSAFKHFGNFDERFKLRMDYDFFLRVFINSFPYFEKLPVVSYDVKGRSSKLSNRPRFEMEGMIAEVLNLKKPIIYVMSILIRIPRDIFKKILTYSYYRFKYDLDLF